METIILNVEGMTCGHCKMAVTKALKNLAGVSEVEVDLENKKAKVQYNPGQVTVDALKAAIVEEGYEVK